MQIHAVLAVVLVAGSAVVRGLPIEDVFNQSAPGAPAGSKDHKPV